VTQTLRSYQQEAVDAVLLAQSQGLNRVLYTQATGTGKTSTFAELTKHWLGMGKKVLVVAHRSELISQAFQRISDHCNLSYTEIGTEMADVHAPHSARVVIGSLMTVKSPKRLPGWFPDVMIVDESHRASSASYVSLSKRFGVNDGKCFYVGTTATAKRADRQSLYARNVDGSPAVITDKSGKEHEATEEESVFQKHVYEYSLLQALQDGWLVPIVGHSVGTDTDLSRVAVNKSGDFAEGELARAVDNANRTMQAISAWKRIASDRPTLVFCASVEHAHHSCTLWQEAGFTAAVVDANTETMERYRILAEFKTGRIQVLLNQGVYCEGTDLPTCSCVVMLRPTKSWPLYVQMCGRSCRTLPGVVDDTMTAEERKFEIQFSDKPDALILDVVDISSKHDLCAAPSLLDLPANLNLEGHSIEEAKKLLDEFKEVRDQVIGECPLSFTDLQVQLSKVALIRSSGARTSQDWAATDGGYRFRKTPPGYQVNLRTLAGGDLRLTVTGPNGAHLLDKTGKAGKVFKDYLDHAASHAKTAIDAHAAEVRANTSKGTAAILSTKQINILRYQGFTVKQIDCLPMKQARGIISAAMDLWNAQREQQAQQELTA